MSIQWHDEYSVGNHVLDLEHQLIINLINEMEPLIVVSGVRNLHEIISKLTYYATKHFYHEEHILVQANYPGLRTQVIQHTQFKQRLADLTMQIIQNDLDSGSLLLSFLKSWWTEHILVEDIKYKDFIQRSCDGSQV